MPDILPSEMIGGQALIEGIMMRGPEVTSMAVRHVSGNIVLESWFTGRKKRAKFWTLPFVRGIFMLVDSLRYGYKCLMKSAELAGLEDEDGNVLRELASGEDGVVRADDLKPGVYIIREIETQAGYRLTEETIRVVIDENYIVPDELFRLVNFPEEERPKDEIQTGVDVPVTLMMRFGAASVICGMAIFVLRAIKKRGMRSID